MIKKAYKFAKRKLQRLVLPFLKAWAAAAGIPVFTLVIQMLDFVGLPVGGLDTPVAQALFMTLLVYAIPNISQE